MAITARQYWQPFRGRIKFNFNWDAIDHDSVVLVTASQYRVGRDHRDSPRFVGSATIGVDNVSPHGPPYDANHGVTFDVEIDWDEPLPIVTDITVLDRDPEAIEMIHVELDFTMQHQQQSNWCWAATSASVAQFYDPATGWTQCGVADAELARTDCCGAGAAGPCNIGNVLDHPLTVVHHLDHMVVAPTPFYDVTVAMREGRPLALRQGWSGGGGHFLVIMGYDARGGEWVAIDDPIFGPADVLYTTMLSGYQGSGTWTHSYFTQP